MPTLVEVCYDNKKTSGTQFSREYAHASFLLMRNTLKTRTFPITSFVLFRVSPRRHSVHVTVTNLIDSNNDSAAAGAAGAEKPKKGPQFGNASLTKVLTSGYVGKNRLLFTQGRAMPQTKTLIEPVKIRNGAIFCI